MSKLALVVEDDVDLAEIFSEAFNLVGFRAIAVHNGNAAIAALETMTPHVIVLDMHMPGMSGLEVLPHIRNNPRLSDVRIIVATADAATGQKAQQQVDMVLTKPVSFAQMRGLAARLASELGG